MTVDIKKFIYAGMFINDEYKNTLKNSFIKNVPNAYNYIENWKMYLDHCTMIFNKGDLKNKKSEYIIRFLESIPDNTSIVKNKTPHITAFLNPLTNKPVDSNKIIVWEEIEPIQIKL